MQEAKKFKRAALLLQRKKAIAKNFATESIKKAKFFLAVGRPNFKDEAFAVYLLAKNYRFRFYQNRAIVRKLKPHPFRAQPATQKWAKLL